MGALKIEITKAKQVLEFDTKDVPDHVYAEAVRQGFKVLLNRGMTKITKELYPKAEELIAAAFEKAKTTFADLQAGKIRIIGAKGEKVTGAVNTEAMRIARALVKAEMKNQKIKVSYVEAKVITDAAKDVLRANPAILEQAKVNVAAREDEAAKLKEGLAQIVTPGMISAKKKAKAEEEKAKAKAEALSATQAGIPAQRPAKGQGKSGGKPAATLTA